MVQVVLMKPIAEQAAERGVLVPLGETAGVLRARGWNVPGRVHDGAVLCEDRGGSVDLTTFGRRTGYVWRDVCGHVRGMLAEAYRMFQEEMTLQLDEEWRQSVLKVHR